MKLVHLLKGKLVAIAIVSVALVAGATAAFILKQTIPFAIKKNSAA
jgi:hypothetical protein